MLMRPNGTLAVTAGTSRLASAKAEESKDTFVIGPGLVIGLCGTGDRQIDENLVEGQIVGVLRKVGLDPWHDEIVSGHAAKSHRHGRTVMQNPECRSR